MKAFCDSSLPRASSWVISTRSLFFAMLLACAGLLAVQAQSNSPKPPSSKLKPPPPKSKSPPFPIKLKSPPPSPKPKSPPASPKKSPLPSPIKSKPPPKTKSPPAPSPDAPFFPFHVDPFFCGTCVTVYGNSSSTDQVLQFTDINACIQTVDNIGKTMTSTLGALNATILSLYPLSECPESLQIQVCSAYYHWNPSFGSFPGDALAKASLDYLVASPGWSCSGGLAPGTPITLTATIGANPQSWGSLACLLDGYSSKEYVCP
ncbi:hypothetical protein VaNZ11_016244 [Volvox africanus]|uniref:Pherophorin domain-containing protein n=1 Tax=Volvox africanus TaxID=51714 RepID=A0ABQ5SMX1_9CHLO|nr:hypothetical protein VaNZ11_016244 [Volvox africanus]